MNLQEDIERIKEVMKINESSNKIIDFINEEGLNNAVKFFGGYDDLIDLLGDYKIPKETYIMAIQEFMNNVSADLISIDEAPIPYKETDDEYHEIGYIRPSGVTVDVFLPNRGTQYLNPLIYKEDYYLPYEKLTYKTITDIYQMLVDMDPNSWD
jgi:hypothetical protein